MSDFTVIVVVDEKNVSTTREEQTVQVSPVSDSVIQVEQPITEVAVSEQAVMLDILQSAPFNIEIIENYECCDLTGVDVPKLSVSKIYSEAIDKFKLVSASSSTEVQLANDTTIQEATVLGVASEAGILNDEKSVIILGVIEDPSFTYAVNIPLFLGANGDITDTPTTVVGEFVTQIGYSLGTGAIFISISEPMEIL